MNQAQFFFGVVLSGVALGCETEESQPASPSSYLGGSDLRVVAPDGRTFFGSEGAADIYSSRPNDRPDTFTFNVGAKAPVADPTGALTVSLDQPEAMIVNPELIEVPISPPPARGAGAVQVANENDRIPSGRVHLELRAGRMTGRVDTPDGTYTIEGPFNLECWRREGNQQGYLLDENLETPLCQRFASLNRSK